MYSNTMLACIYIYMCFFSGWATTKINQLAMFFSVVKLRSTTQINKFDMYFEWLNYDLRTRSANSLCFFSCWATIYNPDQPNSILSGWATIYDPDQPIYYVFWEVELQSTTQINLFAIFLQWLGYDLRLRSTNFLWFVSRWPLTHINQAALCFKWLRYDLRHRSKIRYVF